MCGIASTPEVEDVSDWLSEKTMTMDFHANFEELLRVLLSANEWLRFASCPSTAGVHHCRFRRKEAQAVCHLQLYGRKRAYLAAAGQWPERLQGKN